jgi:hypothetical protein
MGLVVTRERLEPEPASALSQAPTLRTLVQGFPRVGKSHTCVESLVRAFGYGYAINCGTRQGLEPPLRATGPGKWSFNEAQYEDEMEDCILNARKGCEEKKFKWVFVDDFNYYVDRLEGDHINDDSQKDFNRWRAYCNKVLNTMRRIFECQAHVVVTCHLSDWKSTQLQGQNKKEGAGYVNVFPGRLRTDLPGLFAEVVVMRFNEDSSKRILCVNPQGVYGVGCRSTGAVDEIAADLGLLQKEVERYSIKGNIGGIKKSAASGRPSSSTSSSSSTATSAPTTTQPVTTRKDTNNGSANRTTR